MLRRLDRGQSDTRIDIKIIGNETDTWFRLESMSFALCPRCRADLVPMTPANTKHINRLSDELWDAIKARGCPCCSAELEWHPMPQRH
jgi:hypothetical protein